MTLPLHQHITNLLADLRGAVTDLDERGPLVDQVLDAIDQAEQQTNETRRV